MPDRPADCDLHPYFRDPDRARAILDACIADCLQKQKSPIRIVHGKGKGDFRKLVYSHLEKHPDVEGLMPCDPLHGGDGATWVHIAGIKTDDADSQRITEKPESNTAALFVRLAIYLVILWTTFALFPDWVIRIVVIAILFWVEFRIARRASSPEE